jgi:hypothetical protein
MTSMTPEMAAFADMLGKKLNRFPEESDAAAEYHEIGMFRASQMLGLDFGPKEFVEAWAVIDDRACSHIEDECPAGSRSDAIPTEAEYAGMPMWRWRMEAQDAEEHTIARFTVGARTMTEAYRLACKVFPNAHVIGGSRQLLTVEEDMPIGTKVAMVAECRATFGDFAAEQLAEAIGLSSPALTDVLDTFRALGREDAAAWLMDRVRAMKPRRSST